MKMMKRWKKESGEIFERGVCHICRNGFNKKKKVCKAFPHGISKDILKGEKLHQMIRKSQKNQILFEKFSRSKVY